jgi:hypothetical protein
MADGMKKYAVAGAPLWAILAALLCAGGVWLFAQRVLIPYQMADAATHERPRGNLSDLYPRWIGAQELLLHGRDPYSIEVTREIQAGYYGRTLDRSRAHDPKDQQGFAYPVYVAFWLSPTLNLPFLFVQRGFLGLLIVLTAANALLWLRMLRMGNALSTRIVVVVLTLGSLPVMQGLKLQQISLLVAGLLTIAVWLLINDYQIVAGTVMALASVKPQLVLLPLVWLVIWTVGDLPRRYRWALSFAAVMAIQTAAAEWYLPHWIPRFWRAVREYKEYTGAISVAEVLTGPWVGRAIEISALAALIRLCWRERGRAANSEVFASTTAVVMALTVLLIPTDSVYNQILLIAAVLMLVRDWGVFWRQGRASRVLFGVAAILVAWPWISSAVLVALSFVVPRETVERAWAVPFWTVVSTPLGLAAVMLVHAQKSFARSAEAGSS